MRITTPHQNDPTFCSIY